MSDQEEEPVLCAECGRPLSEPEAPCLHCEGPAGAPDPPGTMRTTKLFYRARTQLLFALAMTWLAAPLAAWTARRGLALTRSSATPDPATARKLRRIQLLALAVLGIGAGYAAVTLVRLL